MKKILIIILILIHLSGYSQTPADTVTADSFYGIYEGYYLVNDTTYTMDYLLGPGVNIKFFRFSDSLYITIDKGSRDSIYFAGYASPVENPGLEPGKADAEYFCWEFSSKIKPDINDAVISKQYIHGSLEKAGENLYFIDICFTDETKLQLYVFEFYLRKKVIFQETE